MAVPKKCTFASKMRIRRSIWKRKGCWTLLKAFSLGKSLSTENSKKILCEKNVIKRWNNLNKLDTKY